MRPKANGGCNTICTPSEFHLAVLVLHRSLSGYSTYPKGNFILLQSMAFRSFAGSCLLKSEEGENIQIKKLDAVTELKDSKAENAACGCFIQYWKGLEVFSLSFCK